MANELAGRLSRELREVRRRIMRATSEEERNSLRLFCTYLETQLARYEPHEQPRSERPRSSREREREAEVLA